MTYHNLKFVKMSRKRPTYTLTLDKPRMDEIAEYARDNRLSVSHCVRIAVKNFARSLRQKRRPARVRATANLAERRIAA